MRRNRSCEQNVSLPWIDHAPVTPLVPIAFRAVVARSEDQGRRRVFQQVNTVFLASHLENVRRRRSLALDGSEHDGRLMGNWDGGLYAAIPTIMTLLCACMIAVALPAAVIADERDIRTSVSSAVAVSSPQKLPSAHSSVGTLIANRWAEHIAEASHRFSIPERWIRAVMIAESGGDPHALSPAGAMGLMQIMPATWSELSDRYHFGNDLYEPGANILAGAAYLREMYDRYGSTAAMLSAYNAGPGRYERYLAGDPLPAETVDYVARILPMIDSGSAIPLSIRRQSAGSETADGPLFVTPSVIESSEGKTADCHPSNRPSSIGTISDISALAPLSDGLFVPGSGTGVAE